MINLKLLFILLICLAHCAEVFSQYTEAKSSSRPGQAYPTSTVGNRVFQFETGFDFNEAKTSKYFFSRSFLNSTLLRFGLGRNYEVQLGLGMSNDYYSEAENLNSTQSGITLTSLGWKQHILDADGLKPALSYQFAVKLTLLDGNYGYDNFAPQFILAGSGKLTDNIGYSITSGTNWDAYSNIPVWNYAAAIGFGLIENLSGFVESYGNIDFTTGSAKNIEFKFDGGFAYLLKDNLQLDLYGGYTKPDDTSIYFISAGLSWRTVTFHEKIKIIKAL